MIIFLTSKIIVNNHSSVLKKIFYK